MGFWIQSIIEMVRCVSRMESMRVPRGRFARNMMQQKAICCSFQAPSEVAQSARGCDLGRRRTKRRCTRGIPRKLQQIAFCCAPWAVMPANRAGCSVCSRARAMPWRGSSRMCGSRLGNMLARTRDITADFGWRAQSTRYIHARGFLDGIGDVASVTEQEPVFIQISSLHAQQGVGNLCRVVAPSHVRAKQTQGKEGCVADEEVGLDVLVVRYRVGRRRKI